MRNRKTKIRFFSLLFIALACLVIFALLKPLLLMKTFSEISDTKTKYEQDTISNVNIRSEDSKGQRIDLRAKTIYEGVNNTFTLNDVSSTLCLTNGDIVKVKARKSNISQNDRKKCELIGDVKLSTESGLLMTTQYTYADLNNNTVYGDSCVVIKKDKSELFGEKYFFDMDLNKLILEKNATGIVKADKVNAQKLVILFDNKFNAVKQIEAFQNANFQSERYIIKADEYIKYIDKNVYAKKNVLLKYKENGTVYEVCSDEITAVVDDNGFVKKAISDKPLMISTEDKRIYANSGVLENDNISIYGDVVIKSDNGNVFGSKATLNIKTGNVVLSQSSGIIDDGNK